MVSEVDWGDLQVLIPARSGSKSIKDKNLSTIDGVTLLEYAVAAARQIFPREKVLVSTDSSVYASIAEAAGAHVPFLRPAELAGESSTDLDVYKHVLEAVDRVELPKPRYWIHLRPTTPFRRPEILTRAIEYFFSFSNRPSGLRSVHSSTSPALKWCLMEEDQRLTSLCRDRDLDVINHPRQIYPPVFVPNGYVDIIDSEQIRTGRLFGKDVVGFVTEKTLDIDSEEDLHTARLSGHLGKSLAQWLTEA